MTKSFVFCKIGDYDGTSHKLYCLNQFTYSFFNESWLIECKTFWLHEQRQESIRLDEFMRVVAYSSSSHNWCHKGHKINKMKWFYCDWIKMSFFVMVPHSHRIKDGCYLIYWSRCFNVAHFQHFLQTSSFEIYQLLKPFIWITTLCVAKVVIQYITTITTFPF